MPETDQTVASNAAPAQKMTVEDFCAMKSQSDRRVELLAGFHSSERLAGNLADTEAAFQSRFEAFINKPV